jgi:aminoglycoside/choline kinase family phosphotransferase
VAGDVQLEARVRATVEEALGRKVVEVAWLPGQLGLRRFARVRLEPGEPATVIARCDAEEDPAGRPDGVPPEPPLEPVRALFAYHGLPVPKRWGSDPDDTIDVLEDLGDESLQRRTADHPESIHDLYTEACDLVPRIQSVGRAPISAFERRLDDALFRYKGDLFAEHGLGHPGTKAERSVVRSVFDRIAAVCAAAPQRLAHRDLQSQNLMVRAGAAPGERLVMIDLQGAFMAPPEYDLVCLLRDSYVELSETELTGQLARIRPRLPDAPDEEVFERRFDLLTLSRKGKDLARFRYAAETRGDTRYLAHVPATVRALRRAARRAAAREPAFEAFADLVVGLAESA